MIQSGDLIQQHTLVCCAAEHETMAQYPAPQHQSALHEEAQPWTRVRHLLCQWPIWPHHDGQDRRTSLKATAEALSVVPSATLPDRESILVIEHARFHRNF